MNRIRFAPVLLAGFVGLLVAPRAEALAARSLYYCQRTVVRETSKYLNDTTVALDICLTRLTRLQILSSAPVDDALAMCLKSFRKLENSDPNKTPKGRMSGNILKKCDPSSSSVDHTLADVLGPGSAEAQPLQVARLGSWCRNFGGDGSIDSVQEWIDCLAASHYCTAASYTAARYPRVLEWFSAMRLLLEALPIVPSDALGALDAATAAMDVAATEGVVDPRCGRNDFPATGQLSSLVDGDDGMLRQGAPLDYRDEGNGTIVDLNTGLVWEKKVSLDGVANSTLEQDGDNQVTWLDALQHVSVLNANNFAGHNDWRLPNVRELRSIVDYERLNPAVSDPFHLADSCTAACGDPLDVGCSCTAAGDYWSSTSVSSTSTNSTPSAWYVSFANGSWAQEDKATQLYVRAVRTGW